MADTLSDDMREAIAAYAGPVQRVETRTPEEIVAAGYEVSRGSAWGHDKKHPIKSAQDAGRRRRKRLARFERAKAKAKPRDPRSVAADEREARVRTLIAHGMTAKQIAEATGSTTAAVKTFLRRRGIRLGRR